MSPRPNQAASYPEGKMSRKNVLQPTIITQAQSLASNFTTPPTIISQGDNVGYVINATAAGSSGTFAVQVSMDYAVKPQDPSANTGTWSDLVLSGSPTLSGSDDIINISLNQPPFKAVRLAYTSSVAGAGTATITVSYKSVGA